MSPLHVHINIIHFLIPSDFLPKLLCFLVHATLRVHICVSIYWPSLERMQITSNVLHDVDSLLLPLVRNDTISTCLSTVLEGRQSV